MAQLDNSSRIAEGVLAFTDLYGTVILALPGVLPQNLQQFALRTPAQIYAHLSLVQQNRSFMRALREFVTKITPSLFFRDIDLLTFVANAASGAVPRLIVVDLSDRRFVIQNIGAGAEASTAAIKGGRAGALQAPVIRAAVAHVAAAKDVGSMSVQDRLVEVLHRIPNHLKGAAADEFKALVSPQALVTMAATLALWAGAHAVGVGEAIDVVLVAVGFFFLGMQVFHVAKLIAQAIKLIVSAAADSDLEKAADLLARVIAIIGVMAFIALITKLAAKKLRGRAEGPEVAPKAPPGPAAAQAKAPGKMASMADGAPGAPGSKQLTTAEADAAITGKYGKYMPEGKGTDLVQKNTTVLDDAAFKRKYLDGATDAESLARVERVDGFFDPATGKQYLNAAKDPNGAMLHEGLHGYSHPDWIKKVPEGFNEGVTEHLTKGLAKDVGVDYSGGYPSSTWLADRVAGKVGQDNLCNAYFCGKIDPLKNAWESSNGPGSWGKLFGEFDTKLAKDVKF